VKKIAAIGLLGLLLFNWVGYQLYTAVLKDHADKNLIADLDRHNYTDADLILVKVPATHISSYANTNEFQRTDGKIEIGGVQYNYVKRRLNEGSLEYLCIPNRTSTCIQTAKDEFFKLVNDLQHPGQSKKSEQHSNAFKGFSAEYYSETTLYTIPDLTVMQMKATEHYLLQVPAVHLSPAGQPPDLA
jgi:hypothetical protein